MMEPETSALLIILVAADMRIILKLPEAWLSRDEPGILGIWAPNRSREFFLGHWPGRLVTVVCSRNQIHYLQMDSL